MRFSSTLALAATILTTLCHVTNAISLETLDRWVTKFDKLDFDYRSAFANRKSVSFTLNANISFGAPITLDLKPNDRLFVGSIPGVDETDFFAGTIRGQEKDRESSATITFWDSGLTGRISIRGKNNTLETIHVDHLDVTNQTILYSEADMKNKNFAAGFDGDEISAPKSTNVTVSVLQAARNLVKREEQRRRRRRATNQNTDAAGKNCRVVMVADSSFASEFNGQTVKQMSSIMSKVQQIFSNSFSVGLPIAAAFVDRKDVLNLNSLDTSDPKLISNVLEQLAKGVRNDQINVDNLNVCAVHMFTSRSFGKTLGVAFVASPDKNNDDGGICTKELSTGLSTHISSSGRPLPISAWTTTVAHEIGHSFGAEHDEQTSCGSSNAIMSAAVRISGSPVNQFSSCSVSAISRVLATKATCFVN